MSQTGGIASIASQFINIINGVLVPLLFAIAFIVFLYGIFKKYIWSRGNKEDYDQGHMLILWGLVGFFVMVSVWGLVNVVVDTFGLNVKTNRDIPTFTPSTSGGSTGSTPSWKQEPWMK
jgi:hypothetical protein